ncbi:MAG: nucleotidyltransferase family protein [Candidatus Caldarchaeum sp.]|uniref:Nucleotidyltransferase family protein n=1 Tax=Caldiarchaeum subterraneum TaxID=311458 RepID=A0A7C5QDE7_CALS0
MKNSMGSWLKVAGVVVASGFSRRFGDDKLHVKILDKPLMSWALESIAQLDYRAVVLRKMNEKRGLVPSGFTVLVNLNAERGLSSSLRVAASWTPSDAEGLAVVLADMPFTKKVVNHLVKVFSSGDFDAVSAGIDGNPVNPVVFSRRVLHHLITLEGDVGAKTLLKKINTCVIDFDRRLLTDVDTTEDLTRAVSLAEELRRLKYLD